MKEWEQQQEMKEMQQMGEDALFLMSTPVDATPLEKKKDRMRKRLTPLPMRILGGSVCLCLSHLAGRPYGQDVALARGCMCRVPAVDSNHAEVEQMSMLSARHDSMHAPCLCSGRLRGTYSPS